MIEMTQIAGIGPAAAELLRQAGFDSVESLAETNVLALSEVKGFGPIRAQTIISAAKDLIEVDVKSVDTPSGSSEIMEQPEEAPVEKNKKNKIKKDKEEKKKKNKQKDKAKDKNKKKKKK
jgi:predicted RecB family nuclease